MDSSDSNESHRSAVRLGRVLLLFLILGIAGVELFVSFRGLFEPAAMDQAQIARQIARGEGMITKFYRPLQLMDMAKENKRFIDFTRVKDSNYAPLHPYVLAGALHLTGAADFEDNRMVEGGSVLYGPDRVVASVSMIFFLVALFLSYLLAKRLFDESVAVATVLMMSLSDLMLNFATSGLPQPMMMCFFLGAVYLMLLACDAQTRHRGMMRISIYTVVSFCFMGLLCLSSWMGVWLAFGLLIFVGVFLRPYGVFSLVGFFILLIFLILPYLRLIGITGSALGNAFYAIYNNFGVGEDMVLRSTLAGDLPLDEKSFILRLTGIYFAELQCIYVKMGSIVVSFFFLLSIFHVYKNKTTQYLKWATLIMFGTAAIGTVFFGSKEPVHVSQIYVLLAPLFAAYGASLVFSMIARSLAGKDFVMTRNFVIFALVVVSSGPLLFNYPKEVYRGIWLAHKGIPYWPPYYPTALNLSLAAQTNDHDIIVTDQPWAVAWYADRKALWTPLKISSFTADLLPLITSNACDVQGFLVTPSSYWQDAQAADSVGGVTGVLQKNGEFAPASMEGIILLSSPKKNFLFVDLFDSNDVNGLGSLLSSKGTYGHRVAILGAHMLYYAKKLD